MKTVLAAALLLSAPGAALAHECDQDAIGRAKPFLAFYYDIADNPDPVGIDDTVKQMPPVKALKGSGKFDVLEVWGHIYKADYRMRFLYAQIPGQCLVMGEEIIEASDPY